MRTRSGRRHLDPEALTPRGVPEPLVKRDDLQRRGPLFRRDDRSRELQEA